MEPNIGISPDNSKNIVGILKNLLSDEYILYTKTRNYHWNVTGIQFNDLHKFFESQYEEIDSIIDEVAERSRSLGGKSMATLEEFLKNTRLKEQTDTYPEAKTMLRNLLDDHESVIQSLRKDLETCTQLGDAGTSDFLTGLMEQHEKMAWMLRAFLE
ncbi:MAG: DNA starvation/stationary phase protection protein [Nitrosopumilus sp.]|uniref:Dps family protein n=1 Tax=Nitrosopumilus sp. TaxID=2024843 RepID=UPI00247CB3D5|nr:DNA starvation/stationary phase protection protein [Nitrosopumilus sp.]MCV0392741.1 DNA starvation/stationary phase protection protein [Nitrosopumilus sp.]